MNSLVDSSPRKEEGEEGGTEKRKEKLNTCALTGEQLVSPVGERGGKELKKGLSVCSNLPPSSLFPSRL